MEMIIAMMDIARQKENISFVKLYIDFIKDSGYTHLLLYIENAIRTECSMFLKEDETYSIEEIKEIVEYSKNKGIEIIPALENLDHLEKFFLYKEVESFSECEDESKEGRGISGYKRGSCACTSNPDFYKFIDKYTTEVISLFDSKYVHMGLDEPFDFAVCKKCMERLKTTSKELMFLEHIMHTYNLLKNLDKRMMMWDDAFEYFNIVESLPRDIILCNWNYEFVGNTPSGHWLNRVKKDWFRIYDELGFNYIFCTFERGTSSAHNFISFSNYALKYSPIGFIYTMWEKADCFFFSSYPLMRFSAKYLNKLCKKEDITNIYNECLNDYEVSNIVSHLNIPSGMFINNDSDSFIEDNYLSKEVIYNNLDYVLPILKNKTSLNDSILDLYDNFSLKYLMIKTNYLLIDYINKIESNDNDYSDLLYRLSKIKENYKEIQDNEYKLYKKYRNNIISYNNQFENKYINIFNELNKIEETIKNNTNNTILYLDLMMSDMYASPVVRIEIEYADGTVAIINNGGLKNSFVGFDSSSSYSFRKIIENKKIKKISFSLSHDGVVELMNMRYLFKNKLLYPESVNGDLDIINKENALSSDLRYVRIGFDDGIKHFNNHLLGEKNHKIELAFNVEND